MLFDLIIKNGTIVTSRSSGDANDIAVRDGAIVAIDRRGSFSEAREIVDAEGWHVLPGIIDTHVHFRDPGFEYKEDFATGTTAAAAGGVTMVIDMPNNRPVCATVASFQEKRERITPKAVIDFGLMAAVLGETVGEIPGLAAAGVNAFKIYMGETVGGIASPDDGGLLRAFAMIRETGLRAAVHAENSTIIDSYTNRLKTAGRTDPLAHVAARPAIAEAEAVQRAILLAGEAGCGLHICHLSTRQGLQMVRRAQADGQDVSAETGPHYLLLDETHMHAVGGFQKINPPVRSKAHQEALWQGILDGTIAAIGTDHAPHTAAEKSGSDIWKVISGFVGVETAVPLMLTQVNAGRLSLSAYVRLTSENPARLFRLYPRKGAIEIGTDADFTIVDMHKKGIVSSERLHSRSRITPFDGWPVAGMPVCTIVRGQIVMRDGVVSGKSVGRHIRSGTDGGMA